MISRKRQKTVSKHWSASIQRLVLYFNYLPNNLSTSDIANNDRNRNKRTAHHRKSFGPTQTTLKKTKSNDKKKSPQEYRYSIATTNGKHLEKVQQDIDKKREEEKAKKKHQLKQWRDSQRNLFESKGKNEKKNNTKIIDNDMDIDHDDDDKKENGDTQNNETEKKLSPVPKHENESDFVQNESNQSQTKSKPTQKEMTTATSSSSSSNPIQKNNNNQNKSLQSNSSSILPQQHLMGATASNLDLPQRRHNRPHIINPCVPLPGYNSPRNQKKRKSGGFKNIGRFLFGRNKDKDKHLDTVHETTTPDSHRQSVFKPPKRVVYELDEQKYELYSWLKPTKTLGQGAYATVIEVKDNRTRWKYAIKKNRDVFNNVADARRILRELKLMIHMKHDNIMNLIGCIPPERWDIQTFEEVYLIMNKCDTTLKRVIRSRQALTEDHIIFFAYQIARGLQYMHSGNIIHRDLKPENILVSISNCRIQITDFGLARGVNTDVDSPQKLTEYVVTRWYRAPEVMCCRKWYEARIDVWSLGCIISELYTRKPLWKGKHSRDQLSLIFDTLGTPTNTSWITTESQRRWVQQLPYKPPKDLSQVLPGSTPLARDFIAQCLIYNPAQRPTITQVIDHPFLASRKRDRHYKECPKFNISFEYEKKIKTSFGVRHMMYEELCKFHKRTVEEERQAMMPRKAYYPSFKLSFAGMSNDEFYSLLITGYINQISDAFGMILPFGIAKYICLFTNLCFKYDDVQHNYNISGPVGSYIERVNDIGYQNIYNAQSLVAQGIYIWKLKVKRMNPTTNNYVEVGVIDDRFLNPNGAKSVGTGGTSKYIGYGYATKRLQILYVEEIIEVKLNFEYDKDKDNGELSIRKYRETTTERLINFTYSTIIPKLTKYRLAIAMERTGLILDLFHFYCENNNLTIT